MACLCFGISDLKKPHNVDQVIPEGSVARRDVVQKIRKWLQDFGGHAGEVGVSGARAVKC